MKQKILILVKFALLFAVLITACSGETTANSGGPDLTATPTQVISVAGALPAEPQIVQTVPMAGQRMALRPRIEIKFDRPMNQPRTETAWRFYDQNDRRIPGEFSWPDGYTLAFLPGETLETDSQYYAVLAAGAIGLEGEALGEEVTFHFQTVTGLSVSQVFPAEGSTEVEAGTGITVIFNQPVVPLQIYEERGDALAPLHIEPEIPGEGEWISSSVYLFEPDQALVSGTTYTVSIPAGIEDVSGNTLADDFSWSFSTTEAYILKLATKGRTYSDIPATLTGMLLDQSFVVEFAQPMDPASVAQAVSIRDEENSAAVPLELEWNSDNTVVTIMPLRLYGLGSWYQLLLEGSAEAASGGRLEEGISTRFKTVNLPHVVEVDPANGSSQSGYSPYVEIKFNTPMDFDSFEGQILITPAPEGDVEWYYSEYNYELRAYFLEPSTDYVIRIQPGVRDIYGNHMERYYSFNFHTAERSPWARLLMPGYPLVYRENGEQEIFISYTNVDELNVRLYNISEDVFTAVMDRDSKRVTSRLVWSWNLEEPAPLNQEIIARLEPTTSDGSPLPPGYYYIGMDGEPLTHTGQYYASRLFVVATDTITLKTTPTEALAWVTDMDTGEPLAGALVKFYDRDFHSLGEAQTDENGLAYLPDVDEPYYAILSEPSHVAITSASFGSGVIPGDFGIWTNFYGPTSNLYAYMYTDRPLYRPGQEVYYKGILRFGDDLDYSIPLDGEVYITIDHLGDTIFTGTLPVNQFGTFSGEFTLEEGSSLGNYLISVSVDPEEPPVGHVVFNVAEYRKPEFEVYADSDLTELLFGEAIDFSIDASYYAGGFVAGAEIEWTLKATPYTFYPAAEYRRYSFRDYDRDYWYRSSQSQQVSLGSGIQSADEQGHLEISYTPGAEDFSGSHLVQLQANVTDAAGNLVSGGTGVVVHQSLYYAGIRSTNYIGREGQEQTFDLVVLDWDSNPVPDQSVDVEIVERRWHSAQEVDDSGNLRWVTTVEEIPAARFTNLTTDEDGELQVAFTPPAGGVYKAIVTVTGPDGNTHQASAFTWVSSSTYVYWRQTNDNTFDLVLDKESYSPGETAEILIAQPFEGEVYALVTVERGHIQSREVILLDSNSTIYRLPITAQMAPKVYVSVSVIQGAENSTIGPQLKMGMAEILVDTSQQALNVDIETDTERAGPGDEVTYSVRVTDQNGSPVQAEVSFSLVDKAVLALSPPNSGEIVSSFYPIKALSVRTSSATVLSAEKFNALYEPTDPDGGGSGGGGKGSGDLGIISVRQNFEDTAYFEAQVSTGWDGLAQVTVTLPENLTTWQMDVRAVTVDTRVGQNTHDLISTRPVFVEMQTPRFFLVGDQVQVGALVHNTTDETLTIEVSLEAQGVDLHTEAAQTVEVEAGRLAFVPWEVTVQQEVERVDFIVHATSGEYSDSSKPAIGTLEGQGIPVLRYTVVETIGSAGVVSDGTTEVEAIQMPETMDFYDPQLFIEVSPSLAAGIQDAIAYLEEYPYSCLEQTTSRLAAYVIYARIMQLSGNDPKNFADTLDEKVERVLGRLYVTQNSNGGWGWWTGVSDLQTSAYILDSLLEARDAGFQVSEHMIEEAVGYLSNHVRYISSRRPQYEFNRQAYVSYVLAKAGDPPVSALERLYLNKGNLSLYAKAYLLQAYHLADLNEDYQTTLLNEVADAAIMSAAGTHWEEDYHDYWNWNTDTRTTAIVLDALIQVDPEIELLPNAVRWLMFHRSGTHWYSTQETAWVLRGLTNWLEASNEFESAYQFVVGLNDEEIYRGTANRENITTPVQLAVPIDETLGGELAFLAFAKDDGPGNLYYTTYADIALPIEDISAMDHGLTISRQYFLAADLENPVTEVPQGALVQVRITMVVPNTLHYLVIDDPLPAGLEAVDTSLLISPEIPENYSFRDFRKFGWGWWYFDYIEMYDERTVISADYLGPGTYVYVYYARAATPGTYSVIPVTAEEFYFPDVFGRGEGSLFVITP